MTLTEDKPPVPTQTERSRAALLAAARSAFAERGLAGARVDDIARRAGMNKQLVYHYFGSKDGIYTAVLEDLYRQIRHEERALSLDRLPAEEAMRKLVEFSFDFFIRVPEFARLLMDENVQLGRHLHESSQVAEVNRPIIEVISETLERGTAEGVFRRGIDPLHLYLSIAGMCFFYFSNIHTLSRAFSRAFTEPEIVEERRAHIVDFTLNAIRERGHS